MQALRSLQLEFEARVKSFVSEEMTMIPAQRFPVCKIVEGDLKPFSQHLTMGLEALRLSSIENVVWGGSSHTYIYTFLTFLPCLLCSHLHCQQVTITFNQTEWHRPETGKGNKKRNSWMDIFSIALGPRIRKENGKEKNDTLFLQFTLWLPASS